MEIFIHEIVPACCKCGVEVIVLGRVTKAYFPKLQVVFCVWVFGLFIYFFGKDLKFLIIYWLNLT